MRIAVCIKQVPDTETKIKLGADGTADLNAVKWIVSPYDEHAIEEALKLKAANAGSEVFVFTLGPQKRAAEVLRTALAMGCDEGVLIHSDETLDSFATAKGLAEGIKKEGDFDLVLTGKLAIDDNASAVSQMLAEFLSMPHATVVSKLEHTDGKVKVERETDGGSREIIEVQLPAVVAANKGLNTPRYASLPGIMKAKKKQLKEHALSDLGVSSGDVKVTYTNFELPKEKPPVKFIEGDAAAQAKELTRLLREEAKVL